MGVHSESFGCSRDAPSLFPKEGLAREVLDLSVCTGAKVFAMYWWVTHIYIYIYNAAQERAMHHSQWRPRVETGRIES
jgi:hypothetical protein